MTIEQKDVMQLVGEWGFSSKEICSIIDTKYHKAAEYRDVVGSGALMSLKCLCVFAENADYKKAVQKVGGYWDGESEISDGLRELLSITQNKEYPETVIEHIYDAVRGCKNLDEAERALRITVAETLGPIVLQTLTMAGSAIAHKIHNCIVGIDSIQQVDDDEEVMQEPIMYLRKINAVAAELVALVPYMRQCQNTGSEMINEFSNIVLSDLDKAIEYSHTDILSIVDKPPHVWGDYAKEIGRLVIGLELGLNLGIIDYQRYEQLHDNLTNLSNKVDEKILKFKGKNDKLFSLFGDN